MLDAFFCDAAVIEDGKLSIHGIFSELIAEGFPARHDELVLCAVVTWPPGASGRKEFVVDLLDPEAQSVFTVTGHTDVRPSRPGRPDAQTHLVLPLEKIVFPMAGRYRSRFRIEGEDRYGPDLHLSARPDAN